MITCADPAPPLAIVRRAATPNPRVQRPVLQLARKAPTPRQSKVRVLCVDAPAAIVMPAMAAASAPAVDALPLLALLPAVPAGIQPGLTTEPPLDFDPPAAGPAVERTWLAATAPPAWQPPTLVPWTLPAQLPVVPEPATWLLLGAGVAVLAWRRGR